MSPYLVSVLLCAAAALFGTTRKSVLLAAAGAILSFVWLGFCIYLIFANSFATAALAFLSGFGGATLGAGVSKLARATV